MYCRRCGKEIDYDAEYCIECEGMEKERVQQNYYTPTYNSQNYSQNYNQNYNQNYSQYEYQQPANVPGRGEGIGKGITSIILGFISFIMITSGISLVEDLYYGSVGGAVVCFMIGLGLGIPAVATGAAAIKTFKRAVCNNYPRPVATLILGIVGLVFGAFSLTMFVLGFFALIAA